MDTDVFVAGGGPAGLAAAIAARRQGMRVILAESLTPPIDKACGEGLLPDSLAAAEQLGVTIPSARAHPFAGIRFVRGARRVAARFPSGPALGVRRTVLHQALAEHADRAGVELLWGTGVTRIDGHTVGLTTGSLSARWIVGADGERSRIRAWAGLSSSARERLRFGFRAHYRMAPWTDFVEVYWASGLQIYVTPVAADEVCIAAVSSDPHVRLDRALEQLPELRERLAAASLCSSERGAISATRRLRQVSRGPVALIGDASGSVDAVTGQGLGLAFQQAWALGHALAEGDLRHYLAAHRRIARRPARMAELLLAMDRWPGLGACAMSALSRQSWVFERLLAVHIGGGRDGARTGLA